MIYDSEQRWAGKLPTAVRERCRSESSTEFERSPDDDNSFWSPILNLSDSRSSGLLMPGSQFSSTTGRVPGDDDGEPFSLLAPPPLDVVLANKSKEPMSLTSLLRFAKRNVSNV